MSDHVPVISARTADGAAAPVAFRLTCTDTEGRVTSALVFPEGRHWWSREYRMDGNDVETEPLFELPEEMVMPWIANQLIEVAPDNDKKLLKELLGRAIRRSAQLHAGEIAQHRRETLFAAVRPGEDEVTDLVFTRADGVIFSRCEREWVRTAERFRPDDEDPKGMYPVKAAAVELFDERTAAGAPVGLAELKANNRTIERKGS